MAAIVGKNSLAFVVTPCIRFPEKWSSNEQMGLFTAINGGVHSVRKHNILIRMNSEDIDAQDELLGGDADDDGSGDGEDTDMDTDNGNDSEKFYGGQDIFLEEESASSVDFNDLVWRVEKLRLEEANTKRFLKAGPRFLPYNECRKWVQAWNRWETEEDWVRWIDEGEKRNSYIPSRPDIYYGNLGHWRGWDHFLGKTDD